MHVERTSSGLEAELKATGAGRFVGAGFLIFWLTGWAAGETFALWAVASGVRSLFNGGPPLPLEADRHSIQVQSAVPLAVGLFILVWLIFWTFAGVAAGGQLLRLLFGRDHILLKDDGLAIEQRYGWFRLRKWFPRQEIRRFYRKSPGTALRVETSKTAITLTDLGTPAERAELEGTLNAEFQFPGPPLAEPALPSGWSEVPSPEGDSVLVKDPAIRRKQARTARITCIVLIGILLYLVSASSARSDLLGAIIFFAFLTMGLGWGAIWLSYGRKEWAFQQGRLILQRRFRHSRKVRFEAASLELVENNSGDDGPTYELNAVAPGAPTQSCWRSAGPGQYRRTIHSQSDNPTDPRNLGLWLSYRCQIPFADLTTAEAKTIHLQTLKEQLASSGRFGRVVLRVVERLESSNSRRG